MVEPRNYDDPQYIGIKVGSLTSLGRGSGKMFRFRCDCGAEIEYLPKDVFRVDNIKSCGRPDCQYHRYWLKRGNEKRLSGIAFEKECATEMENQGYSTEITVETGDYGVDFFATVNEERVAFQCKKLKKPSMVKSVQEVYAGGRYYDCTKFVVVSPSGFSNSAEVMASKLGVQLETDLRNFRLKSLIENRIETQRITSFSGRKLLWEIDGILKPAEEWCAEYEISRAAVVSRMKTHNVDLKTALTMPRYSLHARRATVDIDGVVKTKQEWCDEYGISPQLYDYRIKYSGLSPIEALTKEKAR